MKFSGFKELLNDVAPSDELALDLELGDGGPGREFLDALSHLRIREDVEGLVVWDQRVEDLRHARRKPALGGMAISFHKKHDVVAFDERLKFAPEVRVPGSWCKSPLRVGPKR